MEPHERVLRRAENLKLLHQTSRDSPMGRLLRSFWQPIARAETVVAGQARAIRVMGEDLTIYRGESGKPYLVGSHCAHRGTVLHTGWVEQDQIRCMYHGWRYDGGGRCTEIPAEKNARSDEIRITSYPLHEYCGLVFAYMGEGMAPEFDLPKKHFLDEPGRHIFAREQVWDCNWFQQVENSLDAVHVSFVHVWGKFSRFGEELTTAIPELKYAETSAGIRQIATRSKNNVRVSDWTFPNNNHVVVPGAKTGDPWSDLTVWAVPIDDGNTMRFTLYSFPASAAEEARRHANAPDRAINPADYCAQLFNQREIPEVGHSQLLSFQDYVALKGQGDIADRAAENLSASDAGIVLLRKICLREMDAIRRGQPTKRWTRLDEKIDLPIPTAEAAG
ncbi:MAG: iron-sulfur containing oxygenase [Noviherbaspirillum sp.]|nr:iron-sulfur containing oxygenase [Noviherbaspirillum sp.]